MIPTSAYLFKPLFMMSLIQRQLECLAIDVFGFNVRTAKDLFGKHLAVVYIGWEFDKVVWIALYTTINCIPDWIVEEEDNRRYNRYLTPQRPRRRPGYMDIFDYVSRLNLNLVVSTRPWYHNMEW